MMSGHVNVMDVTDHQQQNEQQQERVTEDLSLTASAAATISAFGRKVI